MKSYNYLFLFVAFAMLSLNLQSQVLNGAYSVNNGPSVPGNFPSLTGALNSAGTIACNTSSKTITGTSTTFLTTFQVDDYIYDAGGWVNGNVIGQIATITSNLSLTLYENATVTRVAGSKFCGRDAPGAFIAINTYGLSGPISLGIFGTVSEVGTNSLTAVNLNGQSISIGDGWDNWIDGANVAANAVGVIRLNGASNVTIDGIRFKNERLLGPCLIFTAGANHNIIQNCYFETKNTTTTVSVAVGAINFGASAVAGGNSYNTIKNCTFRDRTDASLPANNAICSYGTAGVNANSYNTIQDCSFGNIENYAIWIAGTGSGDGWQITGNHFWVDKGTCTTAQSMIYFNSSASNGNDISSNYDDGWSNSVAGAFIGIYVLAGSVTPTTVNNNTIHDITMLTSTSTLYGIQGGGGALTIGSYGLPNNVYNLTKNGSTATLSGIHLVAGTYSTINIEYNIIQLLYNYGTGIGTIYGIYSSGGTVVNISNNSIHDINNNGTTTSALYAIYTAGTTLTSLTFNSNEIYTNRLAGTTGAQAGIYNLATTVAPTLFINSNRIWDLQNAGTGVLYGIYSSFGANPTIQSNTISSLSINAAAGAVAGASTLSGIFNTSSGTGTLDIELNDISWLTNSNSSATGICSAINNTGSITTTQIISSNTIYNFQNTGVAASIIAAIYNTGTGNMNINSNTIYTFRNSGLGTLAGIYSIAGLNSKISSNNIWDFQNNYSGATASANTLAGIYNTSLLGAGNMEIQSNSITSLSNTNTISTGDITGILNTASTTVNEFILSNTINTFDHAGLGTVAGIISTTATAGTIIMDIESNLIDQLNQSGTAGTGSAIGISNTGAGVKTLTISLNSITNLSQHGTVGSVTGIVNSGNGVTNLTINDNNQISTLTQTGTGAGSAFGISHTGTGAAVISIKNNVINTITLAGSTTLAGIYITPAVAGASPDIESNQIYTFYNSGNGTTQGILLAAGTTPKILSNSIWDFHNTYSGATASANLLEGIKVTTTTNADIESNSITSFENTNTLSSGTCAGINTTTSGASVKIQNNTINTFTHQGTSLLVGILSTPTAVSTQTISNNAISSMTRTNHGALATSQLIGIAAAAGTGATASNISGNSISALIGSGSYVGVANVSSVCGIYNFTTATSGQYVYNNTITALENTYVGANVVNLTGIAISGPATSIAPSYNICARNTIYIDGNCTTGGATLNAANIVGIDMGLTGSACAYDVANNMIMLGDVSNKNTKPYTISGIKKSASLTGVAHIYFNNVYIVGTVNSGSNNTYCYNANGGFNNSDLIKNNIFCNKRSNSGGTGFNYSVYFNASNQIDFNDYFASGGLFAPAKNALPLLLLAGSDANSYTVDPFFQYTTTPTPGTGNLHTLNKCALGGKGTNLSGATPAWIEDGFGITPRANPPDIGADEFPTPYTYSAAVINPSKANINKCSPIAVSLTASGTYCTAVTYAWSSNPAGFTSTLANPSVLPTINTTYTVTITDASLNSSTASAVVTLDPNVYIGNASVCAGSTTGQLPYDPQYTSSNIDTYSIVWDADAHTAGFVDLTNASINPLLTEGNGMPVLEFTTPAGLVSDAIYNGTLTVKNAAIGCLSTPKAFSVIVASGPPPLVDWLFSQTPYPAHEGDNVSITTLSPPPYPTVWAWIPIDLMGFSGYATVTNTLNDIPELNNIPSYSNSIRGVGNVWWIIQGANACGQGADWGPLRFSQVAPKTTHINPTSCGAGNGSISFPGLIPNQDYYINYSFNGVPQPLTLPVSAPAYHLNIFADATGLLTIPNLSEGRYSDIILNANEYYSHLSAPADEVILNNPNRPIPTITGNTVVNEGSTGNVYTTESGMTNYVWAIPAGGTIVSGQGTYTVTVTWNTAGDQTISVTYDHICPALTPTVKNVTVNAIISITLGENPAVCYSITSANLPYISSTGSPDKYSIVWDAIALEQGFLDVTNSSLPTTPIVITIPPTALSNTYNATISVKNSISGQTSDNYPFTLTINSASSVPQNLTVLTSPSTPLHEGDNVTFTAHVSPDNATFYIWYKINSFMTLEPDMTNTLSFNNVAYNGDGMRGAGVSWILARGVNDCGASEGVYSYLNVIPTTTSTNPSICGQNDGSIKFTRLAPGYTYDVSYSKNGIVQTPLLGLIADVDGILTINNLSDGTYSNMVLYLNRACGSCTTNSAPADDITLTSASISITDLSNPSVCAGVTTTDLTYTATTGSPDKYSIIYSTAAHNAGFIDINDADLTISPISLVLPGAAPADIYSAELTVKNSTTACISSSVPFTVTIRPASVSGTASADLNTVCSGSSTTLNLASSAGSIQWQSSINNITFNDISGADGILSGTGNLSVVTYFRALVTNGTCPSSTSNTVTISINSISTDPSAISISKKYACPGETVTLSPVGGSLGAGAHWEWYADDGAGGKSDLGSANIYTLTVSATNDYYVRAEGDCSGNPSNYNSNTNNIVYAKKTSTVKTDPISHPETNGFAGSMTCEAYISTTNPATSYIWQLSSNGGGSWSPITYASPYSTNTPVLTTPTTDSLFTITLNINPVTLALNNYKYRCIITGDCGIATSAVGTLTVTSTCTGVTIVNQPISKTVCAGNAVSYNITQTGDSPYTFQWYKSGTGSISGATDDTYLLNNPVSGDAGTYYCVVTNCLSNGVGSENHATSNNATLTVNDLPTAPASTSSSPLVACDHAEFTFSATGADANETYKWYAAPSIYNLLGSGETYTTGTLTETTTFYLTKYNTSTTCESNIYTPIIANVYNYPTAPVSSDVVRCGSGIVTFNASGAGAGEDYKWYDDSGTLKQTGSASYTTSSLNTTSIFYLTKYNTTSNCENTPRTQITASINPKADLVVTNPAAVCYPSTVDITTNGILVDNNSVDGTISYWKNFNCTVVLDNPFLISTSGIYYIKKESTIGGCYDVAAVTVTINPKPIVTIVSNPEPAVICSGNSVSLTSDGATDYLWSPALGLSATDIAAPIANPSNTTTYSVIGTNALGCKDTTDVIITVHQTPVINISSNPDPAIICSGNPAQLTATGAYNYTWSPSRGLSETNIANPLASPIITTTYTVNGIGTETDNSVCASTATFVLTVNAPSSIISSPANASVQISGTIIFSVAVSGSGSTYQWQENGSDISNVVGTPGYSGCTNNVLTISNVLFSMNNYTYRCIITNPCGPKLISASATLTVRLLPTAGLWIGFTSSDWNTTSNWDDNTIPNSISDVTIPASSPNKPVIDIGNTGDCHNIIINSNASLTVKGTINATGDLTIQSDISGTGAFMNTDAAVVNITGSAKVQRYIPNAGYHYFSSPLDAAPLAQINDNVPLVNINGQYYDPDHPPYAEQMPNIWKIDEAHTHNISGDVNSWKAPSGLADIIEEMRGYALITPGTVTIDISGSGSSLNKGNKQYTVTKSALSTDLAHNEPVKINSSGQTDPNGSTYGTGPGNGWHLVGNPYPSPVDWDAIVAGGGVGPGISHTIAYFKPSTIYTGVYGYYNPNIGPSGAFASNQFIQVMQAFCINNTGAGGSSPQLSFENAYRNVSPEAMGNEFYKKANNQTDLPLIKIKLYYSERSEESYDETVLMFSSDNPANFNIKYDALKLMNSDSNVPNVYTALPENNYALKALNNAQLEGSNATIIPLGINVYKDGEYKLFANEIINLPTDINVYLEDKLNQKFQNLILNPVYTFTTKSGDNNNRYLLYFIKNNTIINNLSKTDVCNIYSSAKTVYLDYHSVKDNNGILSILTLTGQNIIDNKEIRSGYYNFKLDVVSGIYLVKLVTSEKVYYQKVYIGN